MPYFKHFILIIIFFINVKALTYPILKKYGKAKAKNRKVIFESKDFSNGEKMYFKIKINADCSLFLLNYEYFSTSDEINWSSDTSFYVPNKSSSITLIDGRLTITTKYFTIKKNLKNSKIQMGIIFYYILIVLKVLSLKILKQMVEQKL